MEKGKASAAHEEGGEDEACARGPGDDHLNTAAFLRALAPDLRDDEILWVTSFACDPGKAGDKEWAGHPLDGDLPQGQLNGYISIGAFRRGGRRRKVDLKRSLAIVLDDIGTDDLLDIPLSPTWELETSPHNYQVGYCLIDGERRSKTDLLLHALSTKGFTLGPDKSGNNSVRYVRLPNCINSKRRVIDEHGEPWLTRLEEMHPERRYTLDALGAAFGVDTSQAGKGNGRQGAADKESDTSLIADILSGEDFHDSFTRLAARWIAKGQAPEGVEAELIALADRAVKTARPNRLDRLREERAEIPRYVREAVDKYAPPGIGDSEPIPFDEVDTPEIPARLLPEKLAKFAAALAIATETPEALSVMMVTSVVAAAISKKFMVCPKDGWGESVNLYVLEALPPGNLKSKVFNACTKPLTDWEREQAMILEPEIKRQRSERKTQEKIVEAMRAKAAKAKDRAEQRRLIGEIAELEAELIEPQVLPQLFATNCTPESLENNCHQQGGRFAVISDEGGALETLSGLYTSGRANIDILLKGIDGGPVRVRRKERNFDLNPYLTLALMAQPIVIQRLGANRAFVGYGAIERWLYVLPQSRLGYRMHNGTPMPSEVQSAYNELIQTLLNIEVEDAPRRLTLTSEAREEFFAFLCAIEPLLRPGGKLSVCQGWGGKLGGYVLRIAAGQHVVAHGMESAIDKETMDPALELGALLIDHAIAAFGLMGVDEAVMDAREVWQWILSQGQAQVTNGALSHGLRHRPYGRGERLRKALDVLIERNLISGPEPVGGTRTRIYRVDAKFAGRRA